MMVQAERREGRARRRLGLLLAKALLGALAGILVGWAVPVRADVLDGPAPRPAPVASSLGRSAGGDWRLAAADVRLQPWSGAEVRSADEARRTPGAPM